MHAEREKERYICIKLTDEAGEVVVLEKSGKKKTTEFSSVPNDEGVVGGTPRYYFLRR